MSNNSYSYTITSNPIYSDIYWDTDTTDNSSWTINIPYTWKDLTYKPIHPKCELCKKDIHIDKEKYIYFTFLSPNKDNKVNPNGIWIGIPTHKEKALYLHFSCFLENLDRIKKLLILGEILNE